MYWVLNKKTDEPFVCGSIPVLAKLTGYEKRPLSVHFSEKKETSLNDKNFRIERVDLLRSERGEKNK